MRALLHTQNSRNQMSQSKRSVRTEMHTALVPVDGLAGLGNK